MLTSLFNSVGDAVSARSGAVETQAVDYRASTARMLVLMPASFSGYDSLLSMLKPPGRMAFKDNTLTKLLARCAPSYALNLKGLF